MKLSTLYVSFAGKDHRFGSPASPFPWSILARSPKVQWDVTLRFSCVH